MEDKNIGKVRILQHISQLQHQSAVARLSGGSCDSNSCSADWSCSQQLNYRHHYICGTATSVALLHLWHCYICGTATSAALLHLQPVLALQLLSSHIISSCSLAEYATRRSRTGVNQKRQNQSARASARQPTSQKVSLGAPARLMEQLERIWMAHAHPPLLTCCSTQGSVARRYLPISSSLSLSLCLALVSEPTSL